MKMLEISKDKFDEFRNKFEYDNYCQTSNYGMVMAETGFEYTFIAYATSELEILASGMFLIKKLGSYYYAYCPKGYIIDYNDSELVKKFTHNLIKYFKRKKIVFLKINPEIPIAKIDYKNDYNKIYNDNTNILDNLKELGYKKRKENYPLELLQPKLNAIINLKEFDINSLDKRVRNKIRSTDNCGLELEIVDSTKIDILYEFIKNMKDRNINYYRNIYNSFKKDEQADLLLVKVNYETFLINAKKRLEEETTRNEELNKKLREENNEKNLNEKMNSDKVLEIYRQNVITATEGIKKTETTYIAGAIVIKHNNKVTILIAGVDKNYNNLNPNYFMHYQMIQKYKEEFEYLDINGIADDFTEESKYSGLNKFKMCFNPEIIEYIGELDLIISNWRFKILEKNNLLSNEFTKKKDVNKQN